MNRLLKDWDDAAADALFTENVALDRPYQERLGDLALLRAQDRRVRRRRGQAGGVRHPGAAPVVARGRAGHGRGDDPAQPAATRRASSPSRSPYPPAADSVLGRALATVTEWLNSGAAAWPESLPVAPEADAGLIARRLRMAAAWAGRVTQGAYQAGDGTASVTADLVGEHATVTLSLLVNPRPGSSARPTWRCSPL